MMRPPPSTQALPERGVCHHYEGWIDQYLLPGMFPFAGLDFECVSAGGWWVFQKHFGPPLAPEQSSKIVPPFAWFP